ncbi:hypothetical protein Hypma_000309 [Hypsizygus marmoreus]|uniref:Enoyl reductase (ER) domain-containing protein n=1 Tax=Hypsizygus marmoreus TaxID=39966 RepID=A0A369JGL3_HYPMA|nr:hypothetical protein Hypma_000309 [Hypsizygus marmoreus]
MAIPSTTREYFLPKVGSFDNLTLHTKNVNQPKRNEVLVKVHAVSLQYRDLIIATGHFPTGGPPDVVPCSDMAGEIVAIGPDVKNWKTGDRICANFASDFIFGPFTPSMQKTALGGPTHGVLTEYRTFPAHSLVTIPEHLSYEEASTLPCAAVTAYNALLGSVPVKAGDYVLILGTGGVSIFGLQIAVASGAEVIVTSSSDEKLKIAKKLGAKHIINYKTTPNWDEEVLKITNGAGVNHILEVGGQGTLLKSINSSTIGGYVHLIGWVSKDVNGADIVIPAIFHGATLHPVMAGSLSQFLDLNRLLCANPNKTRPVIDKVFFFEEAKHAYEYLASQAHVGKVVIKVSKD